jgi:acetyl-CoA synthetase
VTINLREITSTKEAVRRFSWEALWALFDGDTDHLNIAAECLDRHDPARTAARIAFANGGTEEVSFGQLSQSTGQFAHMLQQRGIGRGDRVGLMMDPSSEFYTALFGILKRGAAAVPLYTLFGPEAVRERLDDCAAGLLVVDAARARLAEELHIDHLVFDDYVTPSLAELPVDEPADTSARDTAVLQYTSGTTRKLPEAVRHDHRAVVTLARAGLFALGLTAEDRYFCPSSPAWGHGLWHGTIAPLSLGVALGAYSGRYSTERLMTALRELCITNLAAASTVYRMILGTDRADELTNLQKASYTGEELSSPDRERFEQAARIHLSGMYGTTETGVILVNFPGYDDYLPRAGALGKPMPGCELAVLADDEPASPGVIGEIAVWRRGGWFRSKDLGWVDSDGYFYYAGRADDVIISAGWTISPLEVERTLTSHPDVVEAAVVGAPDHTRGHIVKAFIVGHRHDSNFIHELQDHVRQRLSPHEYPREIETVTELPKTVNGKINRKALRAQV